MIDLIKQILPDIESILPFHLDNLSLILSTIGIQNSDLLWLLPTVIPKYLNGISICLQLRRHLE